LFGSKMEIKFGHYKKGYFFTISTIILIIPLIYLVSFYSQFSQSPVDDTIARIRCDELHYLIEDLNRDMSRAVTIFGRRAAVYAIDYVVSNGTPLADYEFTCTSLCPVDCNTFFFENNGSSAAIAELVLCGTLNGNPITYMQNHTLPRWIDMMINYSKSRNFILDIDIYDVKVVPRDAWHFSIIIYLKIRIKDRYGLCSYAERIVSVMSNTSIIGLEDPLYALNTQGPIIKHIENCAFDIDKFVPFPREGEDGIGIGGGKVILYSDIGGNKNSLCNFCNTTSADELGEYILVMDTISAWGPGECKFDCGEALLESYFNASSPKHFGGVIEYDSGVNTMTANCDVTIPWVSGTGDLGLRNGYCVKIKNLNMSVGCEIHWVMNGTCSDTINTSCYSVSDVSRYNSKCPNNIQNGPSFFDRLDGNLNLSEKYVEHATQYFNEEDIGIESFVNPFKLEYYAQYYNITLYPDATWVDYLYWQNVSGCDVYGVCEVDNISFSLTCQHSYKYGLDSECAEMLKCPNCPKYVSLTNCKFNCGFALCDVKFDLTIRNTTGDFMNLSSTPRLTIQRIVFGVTIENTVNMTRIGAGRYEYNLSNVLKSRHIRGNTTVIEDGCPIIENSTTYVRVWNLSSCP